MFELNGLGVSATDEARFETSLTVWELSTTLRIVSAQKQALCLGIYLLAYLDFPLPARVTLCGPRPTSGHG
jgi:hypothetical protein